MLRCKALSLHGRICSAEPWGVTLVPLMARVAGPAPQRVIPGVRMGGRTLSPGLLAGAVSSPFPPAHFAQALGLLQALSGPCLALTSHLGWIHLLFYFNWGIVIFFLTDIIFSYRLPLFMYVIYPVSFDMKNIWMVSYWCPFREKPFLPVPTAWKWMHFKMAPQ